MKFISIASCLLIFVLLPTIRCGPFDYGEPFDTSQCSLSPSLLSEIRGYKSIAYKIYSEATQSSFKGKTYTELANFVDTFGPRLSGSVSLEKSLAYLEQKLEQLGFKNVHSESVPVPKLTRFVNSAKMISPREQKFGIVGTGYSASTRPGGITKKVILVPSLKFISENQPSFFDKIAVFTNKSASVLEWLAAQDAGAAAILMRSLVPFSIYSLDSRHGTEDKRLRIPFAAITNEDVDLMARLTIQGSKISLYMNIQQAITTKISRNVLGDFIGRSKADELVIVSGHADSWDLSQGASDDGIGVVLAYQVPKVLQALGLTPKRTIRTIFWTGHEEGFFGSREYARRHSKESKRISTNLEADFGCFAPNGYIFGGSTSYGCILNEITQLLKSKFRSQRKFFKVDTQKKVDVGLSVLADVGLFFHYGVPGAALNGDTRRRKYWWYHHTPADTMSVLSSKQLDKCLGLFATTAYIMADLKNSMPRIKTD